MRRLWTPGWVLVHLAAVVLVAAFLWLGWWQVGRARSGNLLSFGYAIQWPVFAGFVVYVWIKEMRRVRAADPESEPAAPPAKTSAGPVRRKASIAYDDSDDPELAAYNRYLAWLNNNPHASPSDYPGPS